MKGARGGLGREAWIRRRGRGQRIALNKTHRLRETHEERRRWLRGGGVVLDRGLLSEKNHE